LILASEKALDYTEEVELRGLIPEVDQDKYTFTLLIKKGNAYRRGLIRSTQT
jgi:hypothetical protein